MSSSNKNTTRITLTAKDLELFDRLLEDAHEIETDLYNSWKEISDAPSSSVFASMTAASLKEVRRIERLRRILVAAEIRLDEKVKAKKAKRKAKGKRSA